jgi:signal transduction histidine kinase
MQGLAKAPARIGKFVPHSTEAAAELITDLITDRKPRRSDGPVPALKPERFDQLAHDARNVLSAMALYCELLAEPGVLTEAHGHYAQELQAVSDTASRLVERLAAPRRKGSRRNPALWVPQNPVEKQETASGQPEPNGAFHPADSWPGDAAGDAAGDLGCEIVALRPLLAAIAGPRIELEIETQPCGGRTRLSREDLTRVMLNLVRNASEAMPEGGKLRITAQYGDGLSFLEAGQIPDALPCSVVIAVSDNGPGIPEELREKVFSAGFTTRKAVRNWPGTKHRGLGLSIVRGLLEAAGGTAHACSSPGGGARFELALPVTSGMYEIADDCRLVADSMTKGCIECP